MDKEGFIFFFLTITIRKTVNNQYLFINGHEAASPENKPFVCVRGSDTFNGCIFIELPCNSTLIHEHRRES